MELFVSYDLLTSEQDYDGINTELKNLGGRKLLFSQWIIDVPMAPDDLLDHLRDKGLVDSDDRILIITRDGSVWVEQKLMSELRSPLDEFF